MNKAKPDNCCKGKCELKKELDEDEKKQNTPVSTLKDKFEKQNYYIPILNVLASGSLKPTLNFKYQAFKTNPYLKPVFHPPAYIS